MGRDKLPPSVKKLRGTYKRHREVPQRGTLSRRGIPQRPKGMSLGAIKYWNMLIARLSALGTISKTDDLSLSILAESLSQYSEASSYLSEHGMTYSFTNAKDELVIRPRPEHKIMSDAWARIWPMLKEYGLTFKSRSSLNVSPYPPEGRGEPAGPLIDLEAYRPK